MIHIHHEKEGSQPYLCLNCCGVETVVIPNSRDRLWKHLEDYHDWPNDNKEFLNISEIRDDNVHIDRFRVNKYTV